MLKGKLLNTLKPVKHETKDNNKPVTKRNGGRTHSFNIFGIEVWYDIMTVEVGIKVERESRA